MAFTALTKSRRELMAQASSKQTASGVLLTNGWTNNFYIHDQNETLWGVNAFWYAGRGGWLIGAQSVGSLVGWYEGIQVLTC